MTMQVGFRKDLTVEELATAIPQSPDSFQYMILHNAGSFSFKPYDQKTLWSEWEQGVLFGDQAELRFRRRRGGTYHLVLITAVPSLPSRFTLAGTAEPLASAEIYLWGDWDNKEKAWIDGRIPRRLLYPKFPNGDKGRAKFLVERLRFIPEKHFLVAAPGMLERLCGLKVDGK